MSEALLLMESGVVACEREDLDGLALEGFACYLGDGVFELTQLGLVAVRFLAEDEAT